MTGDELGCMGDPHSPYPHDWRRAGTYDDDMTRYRCTDCGAVEAVDEDEWGDDG